jgi:hypothetical protein
VAQGAEAPRRRAGLQPAAAHDERHRRLTLALAAYRLTIRAKQRLERLKLDSLDNALAELESRGREFERDAHAKPVDTKLLGKFECRTRGGWFAR